MKDDRERLIQALASIIDPVPWQSRWDNDPRAPKVRANSLAWTRDLIARINASGIAWVAPWEATEAMTASGVSDDWNFCDLPEIVVTIIWKAMRGAHLAEQGERE